MVKISDIKNILIKNDIYMCSVRGSRSEKVIRLRCPYCGDSKKDQRKCHLQIIQRQYQGKEKIVFRCVRCDERGIVFKLLEKLNVNFDKSIYETESNYDLLKKFENVKQIDLFSIKKTFNIKDLKVNFINKREFIDLIRSKSSNQFTKNILRYLIKKRKYNIDFIRNLISKGEINFCDNILIKGNKRASKLFERVIFFSLNNLLVQGRNINKFGKRYYIYREDENEELGDIIAFDGIGSVVMVVEGPFDALRVRSYGFPSISLQGKNISNLVTSFKMFDKTKKFFKKFTKIIFCFDNEVEYEQLERYCLELFNSGIINNKQIIGYIKMYESEYKDIDNVTNEEEFEKLLKTKVSFFSPLDRVSNIFKKFLIDKSQ